MGETESDYWQSLRPPGRAAWPPPPPAAPPTAAPPRRRRGKRLLIAAVVVAAIAGGTVAITQLGDAHGPGKTTSTWDPRIQPYVSFVEQHRKLTFKHAVPVDFLDDAAFKKKVTTDDSQLTAADRKQMATDTRLMQALGLVPADFDPLKATNQFSGGAIVGFYSFETKRIAIRGTSIDLVARPTIVHELTHALQDQYFDLDRMRKAIPDSDSERGEAFTVLMEGDAERIADDYRASLSGADRAELAKQEKAQGTKVQAAVKDVPTVMAQALEFPYAVGPDYLTWRLTEGDSVDELFRHPLRTSEPYLNPWRDDAVVTVEPDAKAKGADAGTTGPLALYLLLAQRIDVKRALHAADVWGGDSTTVSTDGRACATITIAADKPGDQAFLANAVADWAKAASGGDAHVVESAKQVALSSCAPSRVPKPRAGASQALVWVAGRLELANEMRKSGATSEQAQCFANGMIDKLTLAQLRSDSLSPEISALVRQIAGACR